MDTLSPKSQETAGRNNGGRGIREGAAGTESMVTAGVVNIDPEIRAARAAQRARWRREQGLPPDDPEPLGDPPTNDSASEPTDWEDLGDAPGTSGAADARDVAEAVERAIEERERRRRNGALFHTALGAGILGHTLFGATRSIGRALQRWGSGEHAGARERLVAGPPEERARRAQMRRDEALARRLQREERAAAGMRPDYDPPAGTGTGGDDRRAIRDDDEDEATGFDWASGTVSDFLVHEWRTPFGNFRFAVNRGGDGGGDGHAQPRLRTTQGDDAEALLRRMMTGGAWGGADSGHDVFAFHEWMRSRGGNGFVTADGQNAMGMTYEQMMALAERLGAVSAGVSADVIDAMPTWTYHAPPTGPPGGPSAGPPGGPDDESSQVPRCSVCLCDAEDGDAMRTLPCMHVYHADCIDKWLGEHATCPICKHDVREGSAART